MLIPIAGTSASRMDALRAVFLSAVVLGLAGAAIQVGVQGANVFLFDRLVFTTRDVVWMAPISWTAFTLIVAVPFVVMALVMPRLDWGFLGFATLTGVVVVILLAPFESIATWAAVLFGLGAGVQVARMLPTKSPRWPAYLGRTATWLVVAFAVSTAVVMVGLRVRERRFIASIPAADSSAPNVILVVLDVVRAANLSAYGYDRSTSPVLERIAREGATFDHAWSVAPWTLPSHASMFTGSYPTQLAADYRRGLEDGIPTLAESFRERGYRTAGFTGNALYTGWDANLSRGFERWSDYRRTPRQIRYGGLPWQVNKIKDLRSAKSLREAWVALRYVPLHSPANLLFDQKRSVSVNAEFLGWQAGLPRDRPFFAFLNYYDAHRPRYAPPEIKARFTGAANGHIDLYDAAVAFMDGQLGLLMDSLRTRGELDNTVIAVVGDHGEMLGEHRFVGHSNMVYRDLLWVPFLLRYPGRVAAGTHVSQAVSLRDVGATLIDVSRGGIPDGFGGTSLAPLAAGARTSYVASPLFSYAQRGPNVAARFPNSTGPLFSLVLDSLHYIRHPKEELLFDLVHDGAELNNLVNDPRFVDQLIEARRLVDSIATGKAR